MFDAYMNTPGFVPLVELSEDIEIKGLHNIAFNEFKDYNNNNHCSTQLVLQINIHCTNQIVHCIPSMG